MEARPRQRQEWWGSWEERWRKPAPWSRRGRGPARDTRTRWVFRFSSLTSQIWADQQLKREEQLREDFSSEWWDDAERSECFQIYINCEAGLGLCRSYDAWWGFPGSAGAFSTLQTAFGSRHASAAEDMDRCEHTSYLYVEQDDYYLAELCGW